MSYGLTKEEAMELTVRVNASTDLHAQAIKYVWPENNWFILVMDRLRHVVDCVDSEAKVDELIRVYADA